MFTDICIFKKRYIMLSKRLMTVLNMIDSKDSLADIGCDHGYLAKSCLEKGVPFVQLVDNKEMPLNVAKKNLQDIATSNNVLYTLADGLSDISPKVNVVAICGMGSELISSIVESNIDVAKRMDYLILEANSKNHILRNTLSVNSFEILDEEVVYDKGKYYEIIKTKYNPEIKPLTADEIYFGPILLIKRTKDYLEYLNNKLINLDNILKQMNENDIKYQSIKNERNNKKNL